MTGEHGSDVRPYGRGSRGMDKRVDYRGNGRGDSRGKNGRMDYRGSGTGWGFHSHRGSLGNGKGRGRDFNQSNEKNSRPTGNDFQASNASRDADSGNEEIDSQATNGNETESVENRSHYQASSKYESNELASKTFRIQSKRYHIDVKENKNGRFIKAVEVSADGRKNKIFLTMATAAKLRNELSSFGEFYTAMGPQTQEDADYDGILKKAVIIEADKKYFLDLKENDGSRFLKVSQVMRGGPRSSFAIPAMGIVEWRDNLAKLLVEFGEDDEGLDELPDGSLLRIRNRSFYFDIEKNHRGAFMKISEVGKNYRTNINIPKDFWEEFRDILDEYVVDMKAAVEPIVKSL